MIKQMEGWAVCFINRGELEAVKFTVLDVDVEQRTVTVSVVPSTNDSETVSFSTMQHQINRADEVRINFEGRVENLCEDI